MKVELGDGYYSFDLPPDELTPERLVQGALTWRYDGQEVYRDEVESPVSDKWVVPDEIVGTDRLDEYFGVGHATRTDELHRRWVLESVDAELVWDTVRAYDEEMELVYGREHEPEGRADTSTQRREDAGEAVELTQTGWTRCECASDYVIWNHSNDSLADSPAPLGEKNRKILWMYGDYGTCSGTLVDDNWVLTAAHCVTNTTTGVVRPNSAQDWCTMENLSENTTGGFEAECFATAQIIKAPGWSGGQDPVNDYAVVKLSGSPAVGTPFPISSIGDSVFSAEPDFHVGYPGTNPGCTDNQVTSGRVNTSYYGAQLRAASGDVQSTPTGQVKYNTSSAKGMSGGAHYYCGAGVTCSATSSYWLTAVQTNTVMNFCGGITAGNCWGNSCTGGYTTGPKGSSIRTWVLNNTP